jgi:NADPH2:quinone reductase
VIEAVGPGVAGWAAGEAACALLPGGGYAEMALAPAAHCLPVPDGLTAREAACLPEALFTVWSNVVTRAGLRGGERFLVHGGASGIGTTAIQLARALGARVFATAGGPDRGPGLRGPGRRARHRPATRRTFVAILQEEGGADVILDMVGGPYLARNLDALAEDGRLVQIAFLQGARAELDLNAVMRRRLTLTGSTLRPQSVAAKARIAEELRREGLALARPGADQAGDRPGVSPCRGGPGPRGAGGRGGRRQDRPRHLTAPP